MKIAFFTQWWPPEPANVVGALGRELAKRGHELQVVTGFPNYPTGQVYPGYRIRWRTREADSGVGAIRVPLFPSHDQSAVSRIANYVSFGTAASTIGLAHLERPDVAYVYHPPITSAWPARLLRRLRGVPFVLHLQDLWPDSVTSSGMIGSGRTAASIRRGLDRLCMSTYEAAAHIIVISPGFKEILISRGVDADKITVVLNWADESVFGPAPREPAARAELGPPDSRILLYAGNLGHYQALDIAIRAAASPTVRCTQLHLTLIGDGIASADIDALIASLKATNVTVLPPRPPKEMPALLAAADAHLVSLADLPFFAATIPGKTQVALASARCLVMAVRGDAANLVRKADAGIVCAPNEGGLRQAFSELALMPEAELLRLGAAGRAYYDRELSITKATTNIEGILQRAANHLAC